MAIVKQKLVFARPQLALPDKRAILAQIMVKHGAKSVCLLFVADAIRAMSGRARSDVAVFVKRKPGQMARVGRVSLSNRSNELDKKLL